MFGLFKKTVDDIVADVQQKIQHLHAVHAQQMDDHGKHTAAAAESTAKAADAAKEATRAVTLAERFTALIS